MREATRGESSRRRPCSHGGCSAGFCRYVTSSDQLGLRFAPAAAWRPSGRWQCGCGRCHRRYVPFCQCGGCRPKPLAADRP